MQIQRTSIAQSDMRSGGNLSRSALKSIATNKIYKISRAQRVGAPFSSPLRQ